MVGADLDRIFQWPLIGVKPIIIGLDLWMDGSKSGGRGRVGATESGSSNPSSVGIDISLRDEEGSLLVTMIIGVLVSFVGARLVLLMVNSRLDIKHTEPTCASQHSLLVH